MVNQEPVKFDIWVPHDGIAIDFHPRKDIEVSTKAEWCNERHLLYAYAGTENVRIGSSQVLDNGYFDQLQELIDERRRKVRDDG